MLRLSKSYHTQETVIASTILETLGLSPHRWALVPEERGLPPRVNDEYRNWSVGVPQGHWLAMRDKLHIQSTRATGCDPVQVILRAK